MFLKNAILFVLMFAITLIISRHAEADLLFAGVVNGTLIIVGDDSNDRYGILNFGNSPTNVRIKNFENGSVTDMDFTNVTHVYFDLGNGINSVFTYHQHDVPDSPNTILGNIEIQTGDGNDSLKLSAYTIMGNTRLETGDGDDNLLMGNSTFGGDLDIDTGDGLDRLNVEIGYDGVYGDVLGNFNLSLGDGNNTVYLKSFRCDGNLIISGGQGIDTVRITGSSTGLGEFEGDVQINTGGNVGTVEILNATISGDLTVVGGGSRDTVELHATENATWAEMEVAGKTTINTASGMDNVELDNCRLLRRLSIDLGSGADELEIQNTASLHSTSLNGNFGTDIGNSTNSNLGGARLFSRWSFESGNLAN